MKRKYATLRMYQPYIDIIRKDLSIPNNVFIEVVFGTYRKFGGDAILYNKTYGKIRIDKTYSHKWTLEAIMHELRHIWQRYTGIYKPRSGYNVLWNGVNHKFYTCYDKKRDPNGEKYKNSPWEIDAREYEKEVTRLFPNYALPPSHTYIGKVGKVTFYKVER